VFGAWANLDRKHELVSTGIVLAEAALPVHSYFFGAKLRCQIERVHQLTTGLFKQYTNWALGKGKVHSCCISTCSQVKRLQTENAGRLSCNGAAGCTGALYSGKQPVAASLPETDRYPASSTERE
jgi:hypothetical protein